MPIFAAANVWATIFYNPRRLHSSLGQRSPDDYDRTELNETVRRRCMNRRCQLNRGNLKIHKAAVDPISSPVSSSSVKGVWPNSFRLQPSGRSEDLGGSG